MTVWIAKIHDVLTDGSSVFGVRIGADSSSHIDVDCASETDADILERLIGHALETHVVASSVWGQTTINKRAGWEV